MTPAAAARSLLGLLVGAPGPSLSRAFLRALAVVHLIAHASMLSQVDVLIGSRGLLPYEPFVRRAAEQGSLSFATHPSLLSLSPSDGAMHALLWLGIGCSLAALLSPFPRVFLAATYPVYLAFTVAGRTFTGFQWDIMLLEATALALLLPTTGTSRAAHLALKLLLFKLYFESGIAKWQSHLHDWHDGSAMTHYYETAPIPGLLSWHAHHLPEALHHLESYAVLALELALPFAFFGPRKLRLPSFAALTFFQVINLLTANYGFFIYLSLSLHLFLLDDRDVARAASRLARAAPAALARALTALRHARLAVARRVHMNARLRRGHAALVAALVALHTIVSAADAHAHFFARAEAGYLADLRRALGPFHVANTYHLFGHITRDRVEPELQTSSGEGFVAHHLRHKPGDVSRRPHVIAPHQPRVDFQLWFYGLSYQRGMPPYVRALLDRVCHDPAAVQPLFEAPLPPSPEHARIAFFRYRFTTPEERRSTGAIWSRQQVGESPPMRCR